MNDLKNIAILGSTGSIGTQALEVIGENPSLFKAFLLTAHSNAYLLIQQALQFKPEYVAICDEDKYVEVKQALAHTSIKVISGISAIIDAVTHPDIDIVEFTVAPQVNPSEGRLPYHEWFVEFGSEPRDMAAFAVKVDKALEAKNIYYFDLIDGNILQPLIIKNLKKDAFINFMRSQGKLGGQNKVPRLSNDRKIADGLQEYIK